MREFFLEEKDGHAISVTEYGNPSGRPILSFHGGPGAKSKPSHAERFDLTKCRVILFDQRGCGKSTPLGGLEHNTTADTLEDAERIREKLKIEKWFVSGGSWGTTLALLYAIKYPKRVEGILIQSVFLGDRDSIVWAMEDPKGVARLMPDVWARRMECFKRFNVTLETQDADILRALKAASPEEQKEIAAGVQDWEGNLFSVQSPIVYKKAADITAEDVASVKVFSHYEMNREFIPENYILKNIETIADLPTVIVHGRYDILCPLDKARALAERMRNCELIIATSSGHKLTAEGETIQRMAFNHFLDSH